MSAILCAIASCFQIGTPHCVRAFDQPRQISRHCLATPAQVAGSVRRPVLSVIERDLESLALLADQVLARHLHVAEADHAVGERLESHEAAAVLDVHAGPVGLDDEAR